MTALPLIAFSPPQVNGLNIETQSLAGELLKQWATKAPRNLERVLYLDGKNRLKDLGISIPPQLRDVLEVVMGWPEKAVHELSNRIVLERILDPAGGTDPLGLKRTLHDNRFDIEFPQAVVSELSHSVAFVSTTPGDRASGEPGEMIMFHSALHATGLWDRRRRALRAGLLINETDALGSPTRFTILTPSEQLICVKGAKWYLEAAIPHRLGRTPMEMMPFRPNLDRPFGRARIDRRVMNLTDRAVRTGARLEVHSEMFSAMKLILLGVSEDAFTNPDGSKIPLWSYYTGRLNTLGRDENNEIPRIEQIKAESPEPHIATMRQIASEFSGHTGVPLGSLGITTDNPESAQSKTVAREDIVADAENQHRVLTATLRRVFENVVMIRDRRDTPPDEVLDLQLVWRRPDRPTLAAVADAGQKQIAAVPELAPTPTGLELLGLAPDQVDRALADLRRAQGPGVLDRVLARREQQEQTPAAGDGQPAAAAPETAA